MKKIACITFLLLMCIVSAAIAEKNDTRLKEKTFKGLEFRGIGPAKKSGRIADIAIHPTRQSIWYVAVGSGGVWKTINNGTTWTPVFDDQSSYSIGCVAIDPNNPEVIWVGTGENVSGRHVGYGDGVYRSLDGGKTWTNMGLKESEHISKILIDPRNSNVVFVAAEGPLWASGGDRGIFKTTDGGENWENVLEISENTGASDIVRDPFNPDVLYASTYQRRRHIWSLLAGGPESGIYKSTDSGAQWRELTNGLPGGDMGKINLAVSPINPDIVYATIEADVEECGFYRSENKGESWEKRNSYISGGTGPHYYQEIYASPHKLDRVYQMDVRIRITEDGGKTFELLGEPFKHSDNHALAFNPNDPDYLLAGSDGGLHETWDHGKSWKYILNLPITQYYKMALDNDLPFYNIVGGTQDNNTQSGPSRTLTTHGILNRDWFITTGGDGYACQIDPKDPDIMYSESQRGYLYRYNRKNGEILSIKPQPAPGDPPERWNWDSPVLISPHSHTRLYFGSQRLWRSDDRGDSWIPVSGDLSRGQNRYEMKILDRVWSVDALYGNTAMSWYGNLTAISESPIREDLIYVGTDDGLIQVTENGGKNWRRIDSFTGLPDLTFVNDVIASLHDVNTVFAVFDNHKVGDFKPYIMKSTDRGKTWSSISGDLPDRHIVWSVVQDHVNPDLLFAGTEFGIFFTPDGGQHWIKLKGGVPTIAFRDIVIQQRENDLVGASFGRSFYVLDDYSPLRTVSEESLNNEAELYPVKNALLYLPSSPEGTHDDGAYFIGPNPPFGAIFTYYLKESLKTGKDLRREREKKIRKKDGDVSFPGYDTLEQEDREEKPAVILTVKDETGSVIRRIPGPATEGFHRVAWDLRYPSNMPTEVDRPSSGRRQTGPMVTPGRYSVTLSKLVNGSMVKQSTVQSFEVVPLEISTRPNQDRKQILRFQQQTNELRRKALSVEAVLEDAVERIPYIKKAILDAPGIDPGLLKQALKIESQLKDIEKRLVGDPTIRRYNEPTVPSILDRISTIIRGHWRTTYGPTPTHKQTYEIAAQEFKEVSIQLRNVIETDLRQLEEAMEEAGAPWTPGRSLHGKNLWK